MVLTDEEDYNEWVIDGKVWQRYKCGEVYTYLKGPQPLVPWAKLVWFSYGIPRHRFLTWLVLLDRCPTRDRLIRWGLNVAPNCLLYNTGQESRNHLFFECPYSTTIWSWIANRCDLHLSTSWDDTILQLQSLRGNIDSKRLCLLATQATIYWIWSERNTRLHQQVFKPVGTVITAIDRQVRNMLQSFRHANSRASSSMTQLWFLRSWLSTEETRETRTRTDPCSSTASLPLDRFGL